VTNLVRNYSPHLNTRSAPPTAELRKVLGMAAVEMLETFLKRWRKKWEVDGTGARAVDEVRLSFPVFLPHNSTSPGSINSPRQNPCRSRKNVRLTRSPSHVLKHHRPTRARTCPEGYWPIQCSLPSIQGARGGRQATRCMVQVCLLRIVTSGVIH
jgi:hypothetical protein